MTGPGEVPRALPDSFQRALRGLRIACESVVNRPGVTTVRGWMTHDQTELQLVAGGVPDDLHSREALEATAEPGEPTDPEEYADRGNATIIAGSIIFLDNFVNVPHYLGPSGAPDTDPADPRRITVVGRTQSTGIYEGGAETRFTGLMDVYEISGPDERKPNLTIVGVQRADNENKTRQTIVMFCEGDDIAHVEYTEVDAETLLLSDECITLFGADPHARAAITWLLTGQFATEVELDAILDVLWEAGSRLSADEAEPELEAQQHFREFLRQAIQERRERLAPEERLAEEVEEFLKDEARRAKGERRPEQVLAELRIMALSLKHREPPRLTLGAIEEFTDFARSLRRED